MRGRGAYCRLEFLTLKVQSGRKFTGKEHRWVNQIHSVLDPTAQQGPFAFWLYHTALTRKKMSPSGCICLRRKVRLGQDLRVDHGQFFLSLLPVNLSYLSFLAGMPAFALLTPLHCLALFVFCLENSWLQLHLASAGLQPTLSPSCGTSPPLPWLTGAWWGCASWERREEGMVLLLLASSVTAGLCPMACA